MQKLFQKGLIFKVLRISRVFARTGIVIPAAALHSTQNELTTLFHYYTSFKPAGLVAVSTKPAKINRRGQPVMKKGFSLN
jgi:hypothetical protein